MDRTARFVTFNVCGIKPLMRAHASLSTLFEDLGANVVCLQELKAQRDDLTKEVCIVPQFRSYISIPLEKKGYSGVAIYVRDDIPVYRAEEGVTGWMIAENGAPYRESADAIGGYPPLTREEGVQIDREGRAVMLDLGSCVVIGLYCPALTTAARASFRNAFWRALDARVAGLRNQNRELVVMGDLNVLRDAAIDVADQEFFARKRKQLDGLDATERHFPHTLLVKWLSDPLYGLHDSTREAHPARRDMYTCWDTYLSARESNFGSRIDYVLSTQGLRCAAADICPQVTGSDHCPVYADLLLPAHSAGPAPRQLYLHTRYTKTFENKVTSYFAVQRGVAALRSSSGSSKIQKKKPVQGRITKFLSLPSRASPAALAAAANPTGQDPIGHSEEKEPRGSVVPAVLTVSEAPTADAKETKAQWSQIFQLRPPLCLHNEECKMLVVKKSGPNRGRAFWVCKRYVLNIAKLTKLTQGARCQRRREQQVQLFQMGSLNSTHMYALCT